MKTFLTLVAGFVLFMVSVFPVLAADPKVGDSVAAPWTKGLIYMATVTGISGDKADLLYEDGDKLAVPLASLRILSSDTAFKVGDHVMAAWKNAQMFPGVITAVTEVTCTVKWDDGDTPLEVKKNRIFLAPK